MASQRLPGKPLLKLAGKSLLQHVYERASASAARAIVIATDDPLIETHARNFGANVMMTSPDHQSGSDRIAEVVSALHWPDETIVVNLQGDEPLMPVACLDQLANLLAADPGADMASLYWPIHSAVEAANPNVVKVVVSQSGHALYFSRSLVPCIRDLDLEKADFSQIHCEGQYPPWKRHVGLYAYRVAGLQLFTQLPPTPLEQAEKLEQLRMLENGRRIVMAEACAFIPPGVDTPEDLIRVENTIINSIR
jgi:3-deoxy-manno-octulosonate cytidylyltransferase (CMP-KDO synthetase)